MQKNSGGPEKECQNIEWKETWSDEYHKWICGFVNAQGGKLYIGIDDSNRGGAALPIPKGSLRTFLIRS